MFVSMQVYADVHALVISDTLIKYFSIIVMLTVCLCWPVISDFMSDKKDKFI